MVQTGRTGFAIDLCANLLQTWQTQSDTMYGYKPWKLSPCGSLSLRLSKCRCHCTILHTWSSGANSPQRISYDQIWSQNARFARSSSLRRAYCTAQRRPNTILSNSEIRRLKQQRDSAWISLRAEPLEKAARVWKQLPWFADQQETSPVRQTPKTSRRAGKMLGSLRSYQVTSGHIRSLFFSTGTTARSNKPSPLSLR